jgi:hypothetical protein
MHLTARSSKIMVSADGSGIVSQAGGLLLTQALRATGLDCGPDVAMERWRPARAVHSPGKIITDLAVALAPGAQLRFTDIDGHRFTCFATDAKSGQLADLGLRYRRRARCEDRIRSAKDTGLRNLPLHGYDQNQIWCEIVALACELLARTQMLALSGKARRWEPKRLRLRIFTCAGRIVRGSRRLRLRLAGSWPCAREITTAITRLQALAPG